MKKLLIFTFFIISLFSCKQKPSVNYECGGYITNKNWKLSLNKNNDSVALYSLEHNVSLKNDFPSSIDSTKITAIFFSEQFDKLPPSNKLRDMIYESLSKSHLVCKHSGTFKPHEINLMFMDGDSTLSIKVDFFAANTYGTLGELHGTYYYDTKTYELKKEYVSEY